MRRHLFFSLILVLGLGLGLTSCVPGVYSGVSVGTGYGYPAYGYGGGYGGQRYYGSRYYGPHYYAPRSVIVAPRASYRGGFGGGERGFRSGGGGGGFRGGRGNR